MVTVRALAIEAESVRVMVRESAKLTPVTVRAVPESLTENRAAAGAVVERVSL